MAKAKAIVDPSKSKTVVDPLALLTASAKKATPVTKKDTLDTYQVTDQNEAQETLTCIGLNVVAAKIDSALKSRVDELKERSFNIWTKNMWATKSKPQNLKVLVKDDQGRPDATMTFQVRFRADGLKAIIPAEIPEGRTVQDFVIDSLTAIGLSDRNAIAFTKDEVLVTQQVNLVASLDEMVNHKDDAIKKATKKLLALMTSQDTRPLNDEDRSVLFVTQQIVTLKEGLFERVCGYCRTIDEVRLLMKLLKATFAASNFDFAISSTEKERVSRLEVIAREFVTVE